VVSIHGLLGYEPNTLTTAPLRSCLERFRENKKNPAIAEKKAARRSVGRLGIPFLIRRALWGHAKSASNALEWLPGLGFLGCGSTMRVWGFQSEVVFLKVALRITPGKVVRTYFFPEGRLGRVAFRKAVRCNYSVEGGSAELPSERRFPGITPGKVVRTAYFPGRRFGRITFPKVVRSNYSPEGGSAELPSVRWFGGITPGKVVRTNYFPEGGSAALPSGRWFVPITLRKVVRRNYLRKGGSEELLPGRWFGPVTVRKAVWENCLPEGGASQLLSGRWFGNTYLLDGACNHTKFHLIGGPATKKMLRT
jgi:hypothetical protein